ncbi:DUF2452 domain-containing protein [Marivirga atlantica]|jgi:hypothetical protein|uniref:DUF2452 domain-containing protein n=1 Tax=Marivirga atlantica TaxID=1548457 RepID=A0A937DF63_9BACT|nr:DUF2452 domain-containing protein [Marivirga atlantica]MBL0765902.1 DUF2452 domain-containing protein [Marivirga atlantica]
MSEQGKKIDVNKIDLEKMKEGTTDKPGTISFPHHSGSAIIKPTDKGKIKGRAVAAMHQQTESQMGQIYEQMQLLAEQAKAIQNRVEISERIYLAKISFEPLINHTYYLYQNSKNEDVLSLIAPQEWGRSSSMQYLATVKLLADHTWEVLDEAEEGE